MHPQVGEQRRKNGVCHEAIVESDRFVGPRPPKGRPALAIEREPHCGAIPERIDASPADHIGFGDAGRPPQRLAHDLDLQIQLCGTVHMLPVTPPASTPHGVATCRDTVR